MVISGQQYAVSDSSYFLRPFVVPLSFWDTSPMTKDASVVDISLSLLV